MLILSGILRNLCSSAPNYTGSLNWTWRDVKWLKHSLVHQVSSSALGRTFSLPDARLSVTSTTSLNHLSPPSEASPAFLHLNIREISFWKQEGWMGRAFKSQNHGQLKSRKGIPPALQTKEEETRGCVVCKSASDVFLALAISLQTTQPRQRFHVLVLLLYRAA